MITGAELHRHALGIKQKINRCLAEAGGGYLEYLVIPLKIRTMKRYLLSMRRYTNKKKRRGRLLRKIREILPDHAYPRLAGFFCPQNLFSGAPYNSRHRRIID
jgi:hypothetical protein